MRNAFSSLRARILLLIAIPFAVVLGLTVYHTLGERQDQLSNARTRLLDTARVLAAEQQRIFGHVHQVLASEALLPEVRRGVASEECNRALAERQRQEPNLNTILLALANGDVICNAIPNAQRISLADDDIFKAAVQTREFSVGAYVVSRTTGAAAIGFAYPILDEAGATRTVVAATLSLAWLKQELAKAQLPERSRVVVVDGEGLVLARHPDPEAWAGKHAPELGILRSILAKGGEGTEEAIGLDGLRRIFGFVPLHRTASGQAYLWVAIPRDDVVGPAERANLASLLVELGLLVLTFGVVWLGSESLFVRRIAALTGTAKELAKGNLAARVGIRSSDDEIGQLAQSVDRMAECLQIKETQRSRAVRALRVLSAGNRTMLHEMQGEQHLLDEMCRGIGEAGGYRLVWVGYAENDTEKSIRPAARWGNLAEGYVENAKFTWSETERGQTPPGNAIRIGMPVVVQNMQMEPGPQLWRDYALRCGCGSCLALPLRMDTRVIGVLNICAEETDAFSDEEVGLLSQTAAELSFGISSQRTKAERDRIAYAHEHHQEILRKSLEDSIRAIAHTVEMRNPYTDGHQCRVGELANAIASELGLAEDDIHGIRLAASIHDLGRMQIPSGILTKPGKLTDIEFALVKTHSQAGYDILKGIEYPWPIASIVLQHHERLDGSGYPQGIEGEQILLGSRIIAVADVIEAMASHRPYRPALGIEVALEEIERGRGTSFDPAVVDACLKLFRQQRFAFQT